MTASVYLIPYDLFTIKALILVNNKLQKIILYKCFD